MSIYFILHFLATLNKHMNSPKCALKLFKRFFSRKLFRLLYLAKTKQDKKNKNKTLRSYQFSIAIQYLYCYFKNTAWEDG